jgi:pectate lyase
MHRFSLGPICFSLCWVAVFACGSQSGNADGPAAAGASSTAGAAGTSAGQAAGGASAAGASSTAGTNATGGAPINGGAGTASGSAGTASGGSAGGALGGGAGGSVAGGAGAAASGGGGSAGGGGLPSDNDCNTPPAASELVGWATQNGGTTGGGNQTPVVVTNAADLSAQLKGTDARVIHLKGNVQGSFSVGSNKTLIGVCGAQIHGHVGLSGSTNVIIRNLKLVGNNCTDSPQDCSGGADAMTLSGQAKNIWIDHLDVSDGSDGNLDVTQGSDFVTVSWTKFSYSTKRTDPDAGASGHRFSNLIGSSDTEPLDVGHLNVTYHHCWWAQNVDQRMPRTRRGKIHVFNNLFTATGNSYCTNAGQDAKLLVQNNVYAGVSTPLQVSANGDMKSEGNDFTNSTGNTSVSGSGFTPAYPFKLDATATLRATLEAQVGPHD